VIVSLLARAKVNLALHVLSRRSSGYHELDSLVVFPEFGDTIDISVKLVPGSAVYFSLRIQGPFMDRLSNVRPNLITSAVQAFFGRFSLKGIGYGLQVSVTLCKHLPVAAGLGGGSSNAAAVLRFLKSLVGSGRIQDLAKENPYTVLNTLRHQNLDTCLDERLTEIGLNLGSDIPVCLGSRPAIVQGLGESVRSVQVPRCSILLVNSGSYIETAKVFQHLSPQRRPGLPDLPSSFESCNHFFSYLRETRNDLTFSRCHSSPQVGRVMEVLRECHNVGFYGMSGSGPSCFALFENKSDADVARKRIRRKHPSWWCVTSLVCPVPGRC